jgi:hypothetical protein
MHPDNIIYNCLMRSSAEEQLEAYGLGGVTEKQKSRIAKEGDTLKDRPNTF